MVAVVAVVVAVGVVGAVVAAAVGRDDAVAVWWELAPHAASVSAVAATATAGIALARPRRVTSLPRKFAHGRTLTVPDAVPASGLTCRRASTLRLLPLPSLTWASMLVPLSEVTRPE